MKSEEEEDFKVFNCFLEEKNALPNKLPTYISDSSDCSDSSESSDSRSRSDSRNKNHATSPQKQSRTLKNNNLFKEKSYTIYLPTSPKSQNLSIFSLLSQYFRKEQTLNNNCYETKIVRGNKIQMCWTTDCDQTKMAKILSSMLYQAGEGKIILGWVTFLGYVTLPSQGNWCSLPSLDTVTNLKVVNIVIALKLRCFVAFSKLT